MDSLFPVVHAASTNVCRHYARLLGGETLSVARKENRTPVTIADREAEALILPVLGDIVPHALAVGEELAATGVFSSRRVAAAKGCYWLVDALDGTKEFLNRTDEFTVNVGLVLDGRPFLGVVSAPALGLVWWGARGGGAFRSFCDFGFGVDETWYGESGHGKSGHDRRDAQKSSRVGKISTAEKCSVAQWRARAKPIRARKPSLEKLTVLQSARHGRFDADKVPLVGGKVEHVDSMGSSLKFCRIAEGGADLYLRSRPTCEWDTASGHALLSAAGGSVYALSDQSMSSGDLTVSRFEYGKAEFLNSAFCALGVVPEENLRFESPAL